MSEIPETPTAAARGLIGWFAGGLAFQSVENLHSSYWFSGGYAVGAIVVAIIDYKLPVLLAKSPQLSKSLNTVAADARWWVGVGFATLIMISLSPYVEQVRWPFAWQLSQTAPISQAGFTQSQVDEKVASATTPLKSQIANLQHQLDDAKKISPPTPPSQPPSTQPLQPATYGSLYPWQIKILVDALTELKPKLAIPPNIAVARPQMVEPQIFSRQFENAILRAGVTPIVSQQNPDSRDQTGVMIGVPDINNPSGIALEMQKIVRRMGFDGGFVALPSAVFLPDEKSGGFAIFIAPPAL